MIKEVSSKDLSLFNDDLNISDSPFRKRIGYYIDDVIVGYLIYDLLYDRVEIVNIYVLDKYRNNKIGTLLLKYLVDLCEKNNIINITLEVKVSNVYALNLYNNFGFVKKAIRKGYYNGEDGYLMELSL